MYIIKGSLNKFQSWEDINNSNVVGSLIYQVTPQTENCQGESVDFEIIVNPTPQISDFSIAICSEGSFEITPQNGGENGDIVPVGTTYTWDTPVSTPLGAITGGVSGNKN